MVREEKMSNKYEKMLDSISDGALLLLNELDVYKEAVNILASQIVSFRMQHPDEAKNIAISAVNIARVNTKNQHTEATDER
jgi:hypothetical protein